MPSIGLADPIGDALRRRRRADCSRRRSGLIATVFAALYHAEVVANRTGEPCGTPVLAVAVVIIEVTLIVSVMIAAPGEKAGLARDTVFAAVMIVCNGTAGTTGASMSAIRDLVREEQRAINAPRRV